MGGNLRVAPAELPDSIQVRVQRLYPGARIFAQQKALSIPMPADLSGDTADAELISWATGLLDAVFPAVPDPTPRPEQ
jgi:transcription-repair coupling factor (superfamily II helicase)